MTTTVRMPAAAVRWALTGPAGPTMDTLIAALIGAGADVESIAAGTAYRVDGREPVLSTLADELEKLEGFALAIEQAPADTVRVSSALAPAEFRRSVVVHGIGAAFGMVARAVDRGLQVRTIGVNRWRVAGRTADLLAWLVDVVHQKPLADVLALHGWTAEAVAAEDQPPTVRVDLPQRRVETQFIERDAEGNLVKVVQTERTVDDDQQQ
ncbi:MAG: hypothetical protein KF863_10400 [Rubrivivax sp.]|nr:hypothetical protein [Rubrivivax sp.]